jgi:hypothetical protein
LPVYDIIAQISWRYCVNYLKRLQKIANSEYAINHLEDINIGFSEKNLSFDYDSLTYSYFGKNTLQLDIKFNTEERQFELDFSFGLFFRKTVFSFIYKLQNSEFVLLMESISSIDTNVKDDDFQYDYFTNHIVMLISNCPFIFANKKELTALQGKVTTVYEFSKEYMRYSQYDKGYIPMYYVSRTPNSITKNSFKFTFLDNELRQLYREGEFDPVEDYMKNKYKLAQIPYFVSRSVVDDEWFVVSSFNARIGFLGYSKNKYFYLLANPVTKSVYEKNKHITNSLMSEFSLDYLKYNKNMLNVSFLRFFEEQDINIKDITEKDIELYSIYEY